MSVKITALPAASDVTSDDLIPIVDLDDTTTKKATVSQVVASIVPSGDADDVVGLDGAGELSNLGPMLTLAEGTGISIALDGPTNVATISADEVAADTHLRHWEMQGGPSLTFAAAGDTITRGFGSWITDAVEIGDTITVYGSSSNDGEYTVANRTASVLTVVESLVNESTSAGLVFIEGGETMTDGAEGATYPDCGAYRSELAPAESPYIDKVFWAFVKAGPTTVPGLTHNRLGDMAIGGRISESDLDAGITDRRPRKLCFYGEQHRDFTDQFDWEGDNDDNLGTYQQKRRASVVTTNATPTSLGLTLPESLSDLGPVTVVITADKQGSSDYGIWVWSHGVLVYEEKAAGASTWSATTTTVTGQASSTIGWTAFAISPLWIPLPGAQSDGEGTIQLSDGDGGLVEATALLDLTTSDIKTASPISGDAAQTTPLRLKTATVTVTAGAGSTTTATAAEYACPILQVPSSASGQIIVLPNSEGAVYIVRETGSGFSIVCKVSGQTGVTIAGAKSAIIRCNGTDYVRVTGDA